MSIGSVNNSPNLASVSTVSGVDQSQSSAQTNRAKQLLHVNMLESEMSSLVTKLEGSVRAGLAPTPRMPLSTAEQLDGIMEKDVAVVSGFTERLQSRMAFFEESQADGEMAASASPIRAIKGQIDFVPQLHSE